MSFVNSVFGFIGTILTLLFWAVVVLAVFAFLGYNRLRHLSESIREGWSNIGVVGRKQASLINQLIEVVKGYQESEKLVMLKIAEDVSSSASIQQMYQQSGIVLSAASGIAQRFPELKADTQYSRLVDSIQACEKDLQASRQIYNQQVKSYNVHRSSIPTVFFASVVGFKEAPYLEFAGNEQITDIGKLQTFSSDSDGERLNALLGVAGSKALELGSKAAQIGRDVASKAAEGGRQLADTARGSTYKSENGESLDIALPPPPPPPPIPKVSLYYLGKDRQTIGPVSASELSRMKNLGHISPDTLVVELGEKNWKPYGDWLIGEATT